MHTGDRVATRDILQRTGTVLSTGSDLVCVGWDDGGVTSYTEAQAEQELEVAGDGNQ
jgi:hypothetical protein